MEMKLGNQLLLLRAIRDLGPITRGELQRTTRLGWGTVTASINHFVESEVVRETNSVSDRIGRPAVKLDMNTDRNFVVGLRIGRTMTRSVLMDVRGNVVGEFNKAVSNNSHDGVFEELFSVVDSLLELHGLSPRHLAGIGIATPGSLDYTTGTIRFVPNYSVLNNAAMKRRFEERFDLPCFLDRNGNCFALAEQLFGHGRGSENFLAVLVGSGISAGIVMDGKIYRGHNSSSGEFGHMTIHPDGPRCDCGNRGCLELYASGRSIQSMGRQAAGAGDAIILSHAGGEPRNVTAREVYLAARQGDPKAAAIYRSAGESLGIAISSLINILNPAVVILGGALVEAAGLFLPTVRAVVARRAWGASGKRVELSGLVNGVCLGAGAIVLREIYERGLLLSASGAQQQQA